MKLRVAVVDDAALTNAIRLAAGEWNVQTGAELHVETLTENDLIHADAIPADAVICASHLLGHLAEQERIAPVPEKILQGPQWAGILELPKLREVAWGKQIMAVPFGSPVFCCYYRADLLEKLHRRPPKTWAQYLELAKLLAEHEKNSTDAKANNWAGTLEPLAPGWAGLTLLARAASSAKHRDNFSTLFNIQTMEPLVAGPPFVQALEELVATAKLGNNDALKQTPESVRRAFWDGRCGMAITWPTGAEENRKKSDQVKTNKSIRAGFAELPGSKRVYNLGAGVWDTRSEEDDPRVPLLAIDGRIGVVSAAAKNINAAFQLLLWLSDAAMSPQVSAASPATTLFQQSNLESPRPWVEKQAAAMTAVQYADATEAAMIHEQWLGALRIPGRAEYLAALDEAVAQTVQEKTSPSDALIQAEKKWRAITAKLGIKNQKSAYRHSLGLE